MNQLSTMVKSSFKGPLQRQATINARFSLDDEENLQMLGEHHDSRRPSTKHQDVIINVSGNVIQTCICILERHPETILGHPEKRKKFWDERRKEYFIDAHPPSFEAIYQFHQTDKMKKPYEVPMETFLEQLEHFEIDQEVIDIYKYREGILLDEKIVLPEDSELRRNLWLALEVPSSSHGARIFAIVSVSLIVLSLFLFCMETLPRYRDHDCNEVYHFSFLTGNVTLERVPNFQSEFFLLETVCVIFFTVEYLLRLYCCPSFRYFILDVMNTVDVMSILPYYTILIVTIATQSCDIGRKSTILKVMRILRVFRIFKLSKHSKTLRIWLEALKASKNEFMVFLFFIIVTGVLFASLLYVSEQYDKSSQIRNIPEGIWWGVATMTTVGYGDVVPTSLWGKITASACVISGMIAVALPTPIIVANFNRFYRNVMHRGHDFEGRGHGGRKKR